MMMTVQGLSSPKPEKVLYCPLTTNRWREKAKPNYIGPVFFISRVLLFKPFRNVWFNQSRVLNRLDTLRQFRSVG